MWGGTLFTTMFVVPVPSPSITVPHIADTEKSSTFHHQSSYIHIRYWIWTRVAPATSDVMSEVSTPVNVDGLNVHQCASSVFVAKPSTLSSIHPSWHTLPLQGDAHG